ncbi:MAG: radical SAM protein [bacterium]
MGYCGLRENRDGILEGVSAARGKLSWYYDPLPTNCVADWVCAGGTGAGYPEYAYSPGSETGYRNLAVFFHACSFDCLYCQNFSFRDYTFASVTTDVDELVREVDSRTACICYFGGDPSPQLPFALKVSRLAVEGTNRILRICWETNGSMEEGLLDEMIGLSLGSGGCIKFDLKAFDENLHLALTGVSNQRTLENFIRIGKKIPDRPVPPLLVASTLLVPGYIDPEETGRIACFIASVDPDIPYSLLAYFPRFKIADLPFTSRELAEQCLAAAREEGLTSVRIGNQHLLGQSIS